MQRVNQSKSFFSNSLAVAITIVALAACVGDTDPGDDTPANVPARCCQAT